MKSGSRSCRAPGRNPAGAEMIPSDSVIRLDIEAPVHLLGLDDVDKSVRVCLLMACGTTLLISAVLLLLGHPLFLLFTNEEPVIEQGMAMLRFLVPTFITYVGLEIFAGAMRGAGEAMLPMIITLLGVCVLRVIWVLVIAPLKPDSFLFMLACYPITWILTSLAFTIYYYSYKWLERCKRRLNVL